MGPIFKIEDKRGRAFVLICAINEISAERFNEMCEGIENDFYVNGVEISIHELARALKKKYGFHDFSRRVDSTYRVNNEWED